MSGNRCRSEAERAQSALTNALRCSCISSGMGPSDTVLNPAASISHWTSPTDQQHTGQTGTSTTPLDALLFQPLDRSTVMVSSFNCSDGGCIRHMSSVTARSRLLRLNPQVQISAQEAWLRRSRSCLLNAGLTACGKPGPRWSWSYGEAYCRTGPKTTGQWGGIWRSGRRSLLKASAAELTRAIVHWGSGLARGVQGLGLTARRPDQCRITRLATPSRKRYESTIETMVAPRPSRVRLPSLRSDSGTCDKLWE